VRLLEFREKSKTSKEKLILARRSISDLLLDLFFSEATTSIRDLLRNPRSDFIFLDKIILSPRQPPASHNGMITLDEIGN
jgi:hypothetical protein